MICNPSPSVNPHGSSPHSAQKNTKMSQNCLLGFINKVISSYKVFFPLAIIAIFQGKITILKADKWSQ